MRRTLLTAAATTMSGLALLVATMAANAEPVSAVPADRGGDSAAMGNNPIDDWDVDPHKDWDPLDDWDPLEDWDPLGD